MDTEQNQNFSIIIPTFHEVKNIPQLVQQLSSVDFGKRSFEVILVDDNSEDGIVDIVKQLSLQYPWLQIIVRKGKKRDLSLSIVDGFLHAHYPILITMDADLSHPAEKIPEMLAALSDPSVDLVIGSRYVCGGSSDKKWPFLRKLTSRLSALIARILLLVKAKDPLSGFLAIRKSTCFSGAVLKPIGWKIGLEIMIKCRCKTIREIPIHFSQRHQGTSKLNYKIALAYLYHVISLAWYRLIHDFFALRNIAK